jgi:hypothetical protein
MRFAARGASVPFSQIPRRIPFVRGQTVTDPDGVLEGLSGSGSGPGSGSGSEHEHEHEHEDIVVTRRASSGLRAIIAVHSTVLGPSLGGARFYPYGNDELALHDVLRLSRAMTAKAALA